MTHIDSGTIDYKDELVRKLIHLTSLSIPIIYYFISKGVALIILGGITGFAIVLDLSRYFSPQIGKVFYKFFGFILRRHEIDEKKKNLNGATYVLLSATLGVLVFPKVIFITAFSILIIGDTMAALIGRQYGSINLWQRVSRELWLFLSVHVSWFYSHQKSVIFPKNLL